MDNHYDNKIMFDVTVKSMILQVVDQAKDLLFDLNPTFKAPQKPFKRMDYKDAIEFLRFHLFAFSKVLDIIINLYALQIVMKLIFFQLKKFNLFNFIGISLFKFWLTIMRS